MLDPFGRAFKLEYYTAQWIKTVENSHKNIFQRKIYRNEQRICY